MIHIYIYIYAANRLWDTDRISRLRRPPLKRRAITHFGEKHVRLGAGWVVGNAEVNFRELQTRRVLNRSISDV